MQAPTPRASARRNAPLWSSGRKRAATIAAAIGAVATIGAMVAFAAVQGTASLDKERYKANETATLSVTDSDLNLDAGAIDTVPVNFKSTSDAAGIAVTLNETGNNTSVFSGTATFSQTASNDPLNVLLVAAGDTVTLTYTDASPAGSRTDTAVMFQNTATATLDQTTYAVGEVATLSVNDVDGNLNSTSVDSLSVTLTSTSDAVGISVTLSETGVNTGLFDGTALLTTATSDPDDELEVASGDTLTLTYFEPLFNGVATTARTDTAIVHTIGEATLLEGAPAAQTARYALADTPILRVEDDDLDTAPSQQTVDVNLTSSTDSAGITVTLTELIASPGVFEGDAEFATTPSVDPLDILQVSAGDTVTLTYADAEPPDTITATATMFADTALPTLDRERYRRNQTVNLQVADVDSNVNVSAAETLSVSLFSTTDPTGINVTLTETGVNTGLFSGTATFTAGASNDVLDQLQVSAGGTVTQRYVESLFAGGTANRDDTASMFADNGTLTLDDTQYRLDDTATIDVNDVDGNLNSGSAETVTATVTSTTDATGISVTLTETGAATGLFRGTVTFSSTASNDGADVLRIAGGDVVTASYAEPNFAGTGTTAKTDTATVPVNGTLTLDGVNYQLADTVTLTVADADLNTNTGTAQTVNVGFASDSDATGITVTLTETGVNTGVFTDTATFSSTASNDATDVLLVAAGDSVTATYAETTTFDGPNADRTDSATMFADDATAAFDATLYALNQTATLTVIDPDGNTSAGSKQTVAVAVNSSSDGAGIAVTLTETGNDTGVFAGTATFSSTASNDAADVLLVAQGDSTVLEFDEMLFAGGTATRSDTAELRSNATIALDAASYALDDTATITVTDPDENLSAGAVDEVDITLSSTSDPGTITVTLTETAVNIGVFQGTATFSDSASNDATDTLLVAGGDDVTASFDETSTFEGPDAQRADVAGMRIDGTVALDAASYQLTDTASLTVTDADLNTNPGSAQTVEVALASDSDLAGISVTLTETGNDTGLFEGTAAFSDTASNDGTDTLLVAGGDGVTATYGETTTFAGPDADRSDTSRMFSDDATARFQPARFRLTDTATARVVDPDANADPGVAETVVVAVTSGTDPAGISVTLTETAADSGAFTGTLTFSDLGSDDGNDVLGVQEADPLEVSYDEEAFAGGTQTKTGTASMFIDNATASLDDVVYTLDGEAHVVVDDADGNLDPTAEDTIDVELSSTADPAGIEVTLTETGVNTGEFTGSATFDPVASDGANDELLIEGGDVVTLTYPEPDFAGSGTVDHTDTADVPTNGSASMDLAVYRTGDAAVLTVTDPDLNTAPGSAQTVGVTLDSDSDPAGIAVTLTETGVDSGIFEGGATLVGEASNDGADELQVTPGDSVTLTYAETSTFDGPDAERTDVAAIELPALPFDFNGDGGVDLAIGVPGEPRSGKSGAGAVNVLYAGSPLSTAGNQYWDQNASGVAGSAGTGDGFGTSTASGDFDGDGFADLAVGVPGETVGNKRAAGAVNVLYGGPAGLSGADDDYWTQNSAGIADKAEKGDRFGTALATGDFDGDGFVDLAIGAPYEDVGSTAPDAGAVHVLFGGPNGLTAVGSQLWHQNVAGVPGDKGTGDWFGAALASGDVNGDGVADLAIGVPGETVGDDAAAGAVTVLLGTGSGPGTGGVTLWHQNVAGINDFTRAGERFGTALAFGDYDGDGDADLAVGVPFERVAGAVSGAVSVIMSDGSGLSAAGDQLVHQNTSGVPSSAKAGERFGTSLSAGDYVAGGPDDLAVGVPFETVSGKAAAGVVNVLEGTPSGLRGGQLWSQDSAGVLSSAGVGELFGGTVRGADLDGDGDIDLAVGVAGETVGGAPAAGAVNVIYSDGTTLTGAGDQLWTQNSPGVRGSAGANDRFGVL